MVTWTVTALNIAQTPQPNTVIEVSYMATHPDGPSISGSARLGPPGEFFVAYADLTEQQVLQWLWNYVNKEALEALLGERANVTKTDALPWAV
jgi:hypothetical protein